MTRFESIQQAVAIIIKNAASIHSRFTQDEIISNRQLETALMEAKNITGWLEFLMRGR